MAQWRKALSLGLALVMMLGMIPFNMNAKANGETFTIIWEDLAGNKLATCSVPKDTQPVYPNAELPTKESASLAQVCRFVGWRDKDDASDKIMYYATFPKAEKNTTYIPVFETVLRKCVVIFADSDGAELSRGSYDYGTGGATVNKPIIPAKASDAKYDYVFDGWELDGVGVVNDAITVTDDAVYKAHYRATPRTSRITWLDANGVTLEVDDAVVGGELPTYDGWTPARASDGTYSYTFAGWTPAVVPASGDMTYTAYYSQTPLQPSGEETHTVLWVDADGEPITSNTVKHGDTPAEPAEKPTKEADERYTYTFAGWTPAVGSVTRDTVYTATYKAAERKYTLNRVNGGTTLESKLGVTYDGIPAYTGITPIKPETQGYRYLFSGWNTTVDMIHDVITMQAQFIAVPKEYPVVFLDENGQMLQLAMTPYGETPVYTEETPAKAKTEEFEYSFDHWTPELSPVSGSAVYTAAYEPSRREYTVTFLHWEVSKPPLSTTTCFYGTKIDEMTGVPSAERDDEDGFTYTFVGWKRVGEIDTDNGRIVYSPEYSASAATYTVVWKDWDGSILETDYNLPYSTTVRPTFDGEEPTRDPSTEKTYTFTGWDPAIAPITGNASYTAQYAETPRVYTIRWMNGDVLLGTSEVEYGKPPEYTGATPTRDSDLRTEYIFTGWEPEVAAVTGDTTYTAVFDKSLRTYPITYRYEAYNAAKDAVVETGDMPTPGSNVVYDGDSAYPGEKDSQGKPIMSPTAQYTYVFDSWDKGFDVVTGDATYTARFTALLNKYTVTWKNGDGKVLETDYKVPYGTIPTYDSPVAPTKTDDKGIYEWKGGSDGWKADNETEAGIVPVKGNTVYDAQFNASYKITWLNGDGTPLKTEYVPEGVTPSYTGKAPVKTTPDLGPDQRWVWNQTDPWTPKVVPATDAATYAPNFYPGPNAYNINWDYPGAAEPVKTTVPGNEYVVKPSNVPNYPKWVNKYDPDDVYDPDNLKYPDADKTYVPLFTITWDNPTDPDYKEEVPYGSPVNKPDADKLENPVENKPWAEKDDPANAHFTPHNATKDETWQPLFNITWKPNNGGKEPDRTDEVKLGVTPKYGTSNPTAPDGNNFSKWDPTPYAADKDQVYTAQYTPKSSGDSGSGSSGSGGSSSGGGSSGGGGGSGSNRPQTVPITWVVNDTKTVTNVPKGDMPVYPKDTPTTDGAYFIRWSPEIEPADKAATYTAVFNNSPNFHARPEETGVDKLLETGEHIIYYRGYPDGTIKPYGNITRNETAMILYRLLLDKDVKITKSFKDVPDNAWYTTAVLTLASLGIITGDSKGNFRPTDPITRAEFTAMCVRFVQAREAHYAFTDVQEGHCWAYKEIMTAAYYGWITGYPDLSFRPNAYIARCEAATVVNRMLGRVADEEFVTKHESKLIQFPDLLHEWYYYEMVEGTNAHDYDIVDSKEIWRVMYDK